MTPAKLKVLIIETANLEAELAPKAELVATNKKRIAAALENKATATDSGGKVAKLDAAENLGVTVSWPVDSIRWPKGVDMVALTQLVGPAFSKLFQKITIHKPAKEFRAVAAAMLKAPARKKLFDIFEQASAPKVTFNRAE